ncbi:hypothetical protein KP509_30G002100 [Ceratopteris richardii]|uniref:Wound-induced protein 1 n=1 Tax=Ceratopteris richardii TaxID=49495 RepID=A0A8T2R053_CERRI|nr:hypothetical protein KP509_30G002100 [Ceratopteris richardii]
MSSNSHTQRDTPRPGVCALFVLLEHDHRSSIRCILRGTSKLAELAKLSKLAVDTVEEENLRVIIDFYETLRAGTAGEVHAYFASGDLDWRFHGPACDQHLVKFLTGAHSSLSFQFVPESVRTVGNNVFVEGQGQKGTPHENKFWVHVWTLKDGRIVQLREYFNTSLTVLNSSSYMAPNAPLWQSQLGRGHGKSTPSLILAM